jgi:5-methylcytosine-specific restriction endonuclease McrA
MAGMGKSAWKAPPGWRKIRLQVFATYGRSCWRCGAWANTVDHVVAVALGGGHELSNLRPACAHHNYSAGASLGNRLQPRVPPWRRGAGSRTRVKAARIPAPFRTSRDW